MAVRGINGFGQIGRQSLKALIERAPDVEVVAVNDLVDTELNAFLFKDDSAYGAYPGTVDHTRNALIIDGREIRVLKERDPAVLPWGDLGVDIVLESTGIFTDADKATAHLTAGEWRGSWHQVSFQPSRIRPRCSSGTWWAATCFFSGRFLPSWFGTGRRPTGRGPSDETP